MVKMVGDERQILLLSLGGRGVIEKPELIEV